MFTYRYKRSIAVKMRKSFEVFDQSNEMNLIFQLSERNFPLRFEKKTGSKLCPSVKIDQTFESCPYVAKQKQK